MLRVPGPVTENKNWYIPQVDVWCLGCKKGCGLNFNFELI
jgi:hypothetical protein